MNEKFNPWVIVSIIIGVLFLGYGIVREFYQAGKDRAYQEYITELEGTTKELRNTNTKLRDSIEDIGNAAERIKSDYTELEKRYSEAVESVRRLENVSSQLRKENQGFGEDLTELEELLSWFFGD